MLPPAVEAVWRLIAKVKERIKIRTPSAGDLVEIDTDTQKKYVDERIERMKNDLLQLIKKSKKVELEDHIIEVTQNLKTDLEELYSKNIMIYKCRKKEC